MKMNCKTGLSAAMLLLMTACGGNGGNQAEQNASSAPAEPVRKVEVMVATVSNVPQETSYSSTVEAYATNNIMPQQGGRIRKINVEVGDYVTKGQVLAEMDRLQLDQLKLQIQNDELEYARLKSLFEEGAVSQSDFEAAELGYKVRRTNYDNLEENTILRSPLNGFVTARNFDAGDMFSMTAPLFTVQQVTPVKLLVGISESEYTLVKKGDEVTLTVDALPGRVFKGRVGRLYPTINPSTHTFQAEVTVPNTDRILRPGMYARVTVCYGVNRSIVLPDQCFYKQEGAGQRYLFKLSEDRKTVSMVPVTLGRHIGSTYEVLSGIAEGETLVVKGLAGLKDGSQVEIINQ